MGAYANASASQLIQRIDAIERETEAMYLELAALFPAIKQGVDESARNAETAIKSIMTGYRSGASAEAAKRRKAEFLEDALRFFESASKVETAFLSGIETNIESLGRLDDIIDRIRADSEEMEIVSLNAMTVAFKSGAAGRAFSVITDELKKLAGRTIQHADDLSRAGAMLMTELATLRVTLGELAHKQEAFFAAVRDALESGFESLDQDVLEVAGWLRSLARDAQTVREPVAGVMQGVQVQDIIRQSLDHVRLALDAVAGSEDKYDAAEERMFLAEITRLSSELVGDIQAKAAASYDKLQDELVSILGIMERVEDKRAQPPSGAEDDGSGMDFDAPAAAYLDAKASASNYAGSVVAGVNKLGERFKAVDAILSRFRNIVTASRIETARNKALAIVSNTVLGMMELTERLAQDIAAAGGITRGFSKGLAHGVAEYLSTSDAGKAMMKDGIERLRQEFTRLGESKRQLRDAESSFRPFTDDFVTAVTTASETAGRINELIEDLSAMKGELADRSASLSDEDQSTGSIRDQRLKDIIDRFTIFTHKETASRLAGMESDLDAQAAESGDVTLF